MLSTSTSVKTLLSFTQSFLDILLINRSIRLFLFLSLISLPSLCSEFLLIFLFEFLNFLLIAFNSMRVLKKNLNFELRWWASATFGAAFLLSFFPHLSRLGGCVDLHIMCHTSAFGECATLRISSDTTYSGYETQLGERVMLARWQCWQITGR